MTLLDLITRTRSYRQFDESHRISTETLSELVNLARLAPSARNAQALKYILINNQKDCDQVFPLLAWAGYLTDWDGPSEGKRPAAYITVLKDTCINKNIHCDDGLAIQNIMLGATEKGLGGCILGAVNRDKLRNAFAIAEQYEILYVIALGKPAETVTLEEIQNNDFKYWRDTNEVHHVPKRSLEEIIIDITDKK